jgi:hypothetical protein
VAGPRPWEQRAAAVLGTAEGRTWCVCVCVRVHVRAWVQGGRGGQVCVFVVVRDLLRIGFGTQLPSLSLFHHIGLHVYELI